MGPSKSKVQLKCGRWSKGSFLVSFVQIASIYPTTHSHALPKTKLLDNYILLLLFCLLSLLFFSTQLLPTVLPISLSGNFLSSLQLTYFFFSSIMLLGFTTFIFRLWVSSISIQDSIFIVTVKQLVCIHDFLYVCIC